MSSTSDVPSASAKISHAPITTARLTLIPSAAHHVRAELVGNDAISQMLDVDVPLSWPPGQYDRDAQEFFLQALENGGDDAIGWFGWYAIRRNTEQDRAVLVGGGGYFGPPSDDGVVEIGYSVCDEWRGAGIATEMARALAQYASQLPGVTRVIAHTHEDNPASIAVLTRSGFRQMPESDQPDTLLFEWTKAPQH